MSLKIEGAVFDRGMMTLRVPAPRKAHHTTIISCSNF